MKVRFSRDALADLDGICDYISGDSRATALRVITRIRDSAVLLGNHPLAGRGGDYPGTREWLVTRLPYLIVYRISEDPPEILIVRVFHTSRDRSDEAH